MVYHAKHSLPNCASKFSKYFGSLKIESFSLESDVDDVEGVTKGLSFPLEKDGVVDGVDWCLGQGFDTGIPKIGDCTL